MAFSFYFYFSTSVEEITVMFSIPRRNPLSLENWEDTGRRGTDGV
jgi:hypothetical protein